MISPIVLIGPRGVDLDGVGQQLAESLSTAFRSIYDFTDKEWEQLGYDATAEIMATAKGGVYAGYRQLMPIRLRAVEKVLADYHSGVLVLPPEFTVYDDPALQARIATLLVDIPLVMCITPSADGQETAIVLDADLSHFTDWSVVNAYWVRNTSNRQLAKQVVYTVGKTEQQTCDDIISLKRDQEPSEIILIGPKLTGKTTIGCMLANALGLRQVSLDALQSKYFTKANYNRAQATAILEAEGIFGWLRYRQPYDADLIEGVLQDEHQCVIDFGGGHSVYEDETQFARVQTALAPYPNVFLILPSADEEESIQILKQRFEADLASEKQLQRLLVMHPSYSQLAKQTFYSKDKTSPAIGIEIANLVNS